MIDAEEFRAEEWRGNWPQGSPDGKEWFLTAPVPAPLVWRLRDAWEVVRGRAEAVKFRL